MMTARMMHDEPLLSQLLEGVYAVPSAWDRAIDALTMDSRQVRPGCLFLACAGTRGHGMDHLDDALRQGAVAVAYEPGAGHDSGAHAVVGPLGEVPLMPVTGLGLLVSELAARFYGHPSQQLQVVGVTGTNGKTSVSQFLAGALAAQEPCGLIGTLGSGLVHDDPRHDDLRHTGHTTPDPIAVQAQLAAFVTAGARYAVMEVSSHALHQGRVEAVRFAQAVFTNLSQDHLDYHGDMDSYGEAKRRLFQLPGLGGAVLNLDDPSGRRWLAALPSALPVIGYGLQPDNDGVSVYATDLVLNSDGLRMQVHVPGGSGLLASPLLGRFNASNLLAALSTLLALGLDLSAALQRLARPRGVAGRMERFGTVAQPLVVVDYAHTPDALEQVLAALREHCAGDLWCVFGCGGDRDRGKRALMGAAAERLADHVVVCDDNPRSEDPFAIIEEILAGMVTPDDAYVIRDRGAAIERALSRAAVGDVVLVAGKGHETEQQVGNLRIPFSDREAVTRLLANRGGERG